MSMALHLGDCLYVMDLLPERSVDLVLADLPYGTTACRWDTQIPLAPLWAQYRRLCHGAIVLTAQTPFAQILGASNIKSLRYEWVWEKTAATGQLNSKKMPMKAHENVLIFYDRQPTYNPQKTNGHARKTAWANRGNKNKKQGEHYGEQTGVTFYDSTERFPRSVVKFAHDNRVVGRHPTQKPVALMEYMIRTYTNPGDTVLDNCMGSGTTGLACLNTGRNFIGIESDPTYYKTACDRLGYAVT